MGWKISLPSITLPPLCANLLIFRQTPTLLPEWRISLLNPGTNAIRKRFFSTLRHLTTFLRTTISQKPRKNLYILITYKERLGGLNLLIIELIKKNYVMIMIEESWFLGHLKVKLCASSQRGAFYLCLQKENIIYCDT